MQEEAPVLVPRHAVSDANARSMDYADCTRQKQLQGVRLKHDTVHWLLSEVDAGKILFADR